MCRKAQLDPNRKSFIINMELGVLQCEEPSLKLDHRLYQKNLNPWIETRGSFLKNLKVGTEIESSFENWELTNISFNCDSLCLNLFYMPSCKHYTTWWGPILFCLHVISQHLVLFGVNMKSQTMWNEGNLSYVDMIVKKIGFNLWQFD
jgi:hypothetical protein